MWKESDKRYKDAVRHGGQRARLLALFGPKCSSCGETKDERDIVAHHVSGKPTEHEVQVLLCRSCHALSHRVGEDRIKISRPQIEGVISRAPRFIDAAKELGVSLDTLNKRRKRFDLKRKCKNCGSDFVPTRKLRKYCSDDCATKGKAEAYENRPKPTKERKAEIDRAYRERHKEELACKKHEFYMANAEKIKERTREWYKNRKASLAT